MINDNPFAHQLIKTPIAKACEFDADPFQRAARIVLYIT